MGSPSFRKEKSKSDGPRLSLIGANHRTCAIDTREALLRRVTYRQILGGSNVGRPFVDLVLLRTCCRVEAYSLSAHPDRATATIRRAFALRREAGDLYELEGVDAAAHLLRAAAGLDSIALGEPQIADQVRQASTERPGGERRGTPIGYLFRRAAHVAPSLRRIAGIEGRSTSVSHAAVRFLRDAVPSSDVRITLVGTGKMARLAAESLHAGARLTILDRSFGKSQAAAADLGSRAERLSALPKALIDTDVLIAATSSDERLLPADALRDALETRSGRPLWIIDLGMPRNVDPGAAELEGIRLVTIDDLVPWTASPPNPAALARVEHRIRKEAETLVEGLRPRTGDPVAALRSAAEQIRRTEVERALSRMPTASAVDRAVVDKMADRLVNRILHAPTELVRHFRAEGDEATIARLLPPTTGGDR